MAKGYLSWALALLLCALASLSGAQYEHGIPHCKDVKPSNITLMQPIDIDQEHDLRLKKSKSSSNEPEEDVQMFNWNLTLFQNELKNLSRCVNYTAAHDPCVITKKVDASTIYMLLLFLDVDCDEGTPRAIKGAMLSFKGNFKEETKVETTTTTTTTTTETSVDLEMLTAQKC
ncbi:uncharacterized protein LOC122258996 [Penaeus japonicus]|uniref:uncharacterized protein LOC122258996 n=1 Tax=Penaeus japonicus TaxID=27405 RepID=UPI001C7147EB|nr:uncharacterized protein LOC122258996 [Penaeus japonicus]